jgi:hypothetical protein
VKAPEGWMRGMEGERWTYKIVLFPHFLGVEIPTTYAPPCLFIFSRTQ